MKPRLGNLPAQLVVDPGGGLVPASVQENFDAIRAFLNNPFVSFPLSDYAAAAEGTASGTNVDLATDGPSITVPLAGDYLLTANMLAANSTAGAYATSEIVIGGIASGVILFTQSATAGNGAYPSLVGVPITVLADGDVVKMRYRTGGGGTATFAQRALTLTRLAV